MLLAGLLLDHLWGEPQRWHPLVGLGHIANWLEKQLNHGSHLQRFTGGLTGWLILTITPVLCVTGLQRIAPTVLDMAMSILLLWLCIARRSLKEHTQPIAIALDVGQTDLARQRTGYIVSRDTADMNEAQMSRAATESILENGNDAVVAPLFWFLIAGPVGCVAHRVINTLDAMWGYRTGRYEWFGKWAARADDVVAWVPARLTAAAYMIMGNVRGAWTAWRRDAGHLASPNGGPCMAAGAGALGVTLGGPCYYHGKRHDKPFFGGERACTATDIRAALRLLDRALGLLVVFTALCLLLANALAGGLS